MNKIAALSLASHFMAALFGVAAVLAAGTVIANAQNPVTAPSNTSRSGTQSVIIQKRDSLQRGKLSDQPTATQQQSTTKNSSPAMSGK